MSSPIPPDPYVALGVPKDADLSAIRSAHRKLVLKYHPDRIQDESQKEEGKTKFQKIQQAYELLSDKVLRERYDNKIKLAELKRDAMMRGEMPMRDVPIRSASSYTSRPAPPSATSYRDVRDDMRYRTEERVPASERKPTSAYRDTRDTRDTSSYFSSRESFEEPVPRTSNRKPAEPDRKVSYSRPAEKEKSSTKSKVSAAEAAFFTVHMAAKLKRAAQSARENKEKEKVKEREVHERKAEARDRTKRDDRNEKYSNHRAFVEDYSDDSDTVTNVSRATIRPSKSSPRSRPENIKRPSTAGNDRPRPRHHDDEDSYDDKYERNHARSREYINESKARPNMPRTDSAQDSYYWHSDYQNSHSRRSGSDSDRRPSSKTKRSAEKGTSTRPSMPTQSSAPGNLKAYTEVREPSRSTSGSTVPRDRDYRKDMRDVPTFARSQTMPTSRNSRKDSAPSKSSGLKHGETQHYHDSGYGSSSTSPITPELREESPSREPKYQSKKLYVVDPLQSDNEDSRSHRVRPMTSDDERRRERRPRMSEEHRSRTTRPPQSYPARPAPRRGESDIHETRSPAETPTGSRENSRNRLFREISPEPPKKGSSYSRKVPLESINTAPRRDHASAAYTPYVTREPDEYQRDYSPNSTFHTDLRYARMEQRRPSVN